MRWLNNRPPWPAIAYTIVLVLILVQPVFASPDVRILIDVSGSMKQNDPANLRVPAMRLVSELLPVGTTAGVWLFAESVSPLLEPAVVDEAWRERAREKLNQIHSRGLFTDIEKAIDAATTGWEQQAEHGERHIILLTDGMVDVSRVSAESAASRARILSGQLDRLRMFDAHIHAIALSDNVDKELLDALTATTQGFTERADDAAKLQRIFLHMLEQSAPPMTVPIENNQFEIDTSVSELTLLIFRAGDEVTRLYPPAAADFDASTLPDNARWRGEAGYDLITIKDPAAGTWRFDGLDDPDNRAVIVTNLAMNMNTIPGTMLSGETTDLDAWLTEDGQPIARMDLLELVKATLEIRFPDGADAAGEMLLNKERKVFESRLDGRALAPNDYELTVILDSGTFKRQLKRRIRINSDPITVTYATQPGETSLVTMTLAADSELVDVASLGGYLIVTDSTNATRAFPLPEMINAAAVLEVEASAAGAHVFEPQVYFTTRYGRSLHLAPVPQSLDLTYAAALADEGAEEPAAEPAEPISWKRVAVLVVAGNLILALGLGVLWWLYGRKTDRKTPGIEHDEAVEAVAA